MKQLTRFIQLFLAGVFLLTLNYSCVKEYLDFSKYSKELEINGGYLGPVAYGVFTAKDLLEKFDKKNKVQEYSGGSLDKVLYIRFEENVASKTAADIVPLPAPEYVNIYLGNEITMEPLFFTAGGFNETIERNLFSFSKRRIIDKVILDSGNLNIRIKCSIPRTGTFALSFPGLVSETGAPLSKTYNKTSALTNLDVSEKISLNRYTINLLHDPIPYDSNYLQIEYTIRFGNEPNPIQPDDSLNFTMNISDLNFSRMQGFFGRDTFINQDSIQLDINIIEGTEEFKFLEPRLTMRVVNSLGLPINISLDNLVAINNENIPPLNQAITFICPDCPDSVHIQYPTLAQLGQTLTTDKVFDQANSPGFNTAINGDPKFIKYEAEGVSNRHHDSNDLTEFVTDDGKFDLMVGIEMPMYGYTSNFVLRDTQKLNMKELAGDASMIENLLIRIKTINGLPGEIYGQVFFVDSNYKIIDSVFSSIPQITKSPPVDANGYVTGTQESVSDIKKQGQTLDNYQNVRHAVIRLRMSTTDAPKAIRILSTNKIEMYIFMDIDFKLRTNDLNKLF